MASPLQWQSRQGAITFVPTIFLRLGKVSGNWDDKLQLRSLDPGWTPEKGMRSGLQKQHWLRKGRACQAVLLWCFSMTSLGSVSHLLEPRESVRESNNGSWWNAYTSHCPAEKCQCVRDRACLKILKRPAVVVYPSPCRLLPAPTWKEELIPLSVCCQWLCRTRKYVAVNYI